MAWVAVATGGASILGGFLKSHQAHLQQKMADSIHPQNTTYNVSPYAQNQLQTVRNAYNGRMAGAANAENNIAANQANSFQGAERNASSGSQALSILAGLQGNTNQANQGLQDAEGRNQNALLGQLGAANQGMTNENDKVYNDQLRNYNNDLQAKNQLQAASMQNRNSAIDGISNGLIYASSQFGNKGNKPDVPVTQNNLDAMKFGGGTPNMANIGSPNPMNPYVPQINNYQGIPMQSYGDSGQYPMWGSSKRNGWF